MRKVWPLQAVFDMGLKRFGSTEGDDDEAGETTRMRELVSVGAAYAVNCTSSLDKYLAAARSVGVTDDEIEAVVDLARFIKGRADSLRVFLLGLDELYRDNAAVRRALDVATKAYSMVNSCVCRQGEERLSFGSHAFGFGGGLHHNLGAVP